MAKLANNELDLINRLKKNDLQALNTLMDLYKKYLFRLAFRFLGNKQDAEEVLQDTFLRAFQNIESFKDAPALLHGCIEFVSINVSIKKIDQKSINLFCMKAMKHRLMKFDWLKRVMSKNLSYKKN